MINIKRCLKDERLMKAMTGVTIEEFKKLTKDFRKELDKDNIKRYKQRKETNDKSRKSGGGQKGILDTIEKKLFFVLVYLKCYPTFDFMGLLFDLSRKNSKKRVDKLMPVLEKTLKSKLVLPKRKVSNMEEFLKICPEMKDVFMDGTERPHHRKKDYKKQKEMYSGKKKRHTTKNIVINDESKRIRYLSPTMNGKEHDLSIFDKFFDSDTIPKNINFWLDLGFLGIDKYFPKMSFSMPKRKPKGKDQPKKVKEDNKIISGIRIVSEHAIGGIKRYRAITDVFRNKSLKFNDLVMNISCGLWNYHLNQC